MTFVSKFIVRRKELSWNHRILVAVKRITVYSSSRAWPMLYNSVTCSLFCYSLLHLHNWNFFTFSFKLHLSPNSLCIGDSVFWIKLINLLIDWFAFNGMLIQWYKNVIHPNPSKVKSLLICINWWKVCLILSAGASVYSLSDDQDQIKTELLKHGPIEVDFSVYGDFPSYKSGAFIHMQAVNYY